MTLHDDGRDRHRDWELARRYDNYPIYDMLYVALAERLGEPLVTLDDKLRRRLAHLDLVLRPDEVLKSGLHRTSDKNAEATRAGDRPSSQQRGYRASWGADDVVSNWRSLIGDLIFAPSRQAARCKRRS
ncbi:MAG: type II toxin-antitoxin system VapC family toxin [Pseudonocardiaceae bacterium]